MFDVAQMYKQTAEKIPHHDQSFVEGKQTHEKDIPYCPNSFEVHFFLNPRIHSLRVDSVLFILLIVSAKDNCFHEYLSTSR